MSLLGIQPNEHQRGQLEHLALKRSAYEQQQYEPGAEDV
jgi:hypothetical protein